MNKPAYSPDIYLSFFMFTTDLKPDNLEYRKTVVGHIKELKKFGYTGFEFPIGTSNPENYAQDVENYRNLRQYLDSEGLADIKISTNVGATQTFDPSSSSAKQREAALEYLKSRVDVTAALGGEIMMGPIVIPYGVFPTTDCNDGIWSDQLQDHLAIRYQNAQPILNELGKYAERKNVKLAIEPITHWETPGPNKLSQLIDFLKGVESKQVGVVIDSAHEILDGDGPEKFAEQVNYLAQQKRLHYIQVSPPDRGALHTCWLPWQTFLKPVLPVYTGPIAVEVFNAIPAFASSLRLSRRKFWIPGEDQPNCYPSAYDIADKAIQVTKKEIQKALK
ncbi:sugar phosphate isomerase/epimerase family protein [Sphaerospermopsis torques-reginae]|uniref:Sugar phosphate isomerase/epimerase n=1 Tax=Sphaerospermopsis torques-reginae ITEP-024 TaxID=984208 RepID=A0ABX8WXZ1_9CYAN|nr:sugar phosphate isomerase/epimerase family protein [Sphaerospermopsis torques-reginae]QYX31279.1 sugar phosphate isomerase/epimerase [Sphaerospermopsis torques-reginae ITEP-024]